MVREWCASYILTSKCASRHNGVHFFDISTSKSGPTLGVLYMFTSKCASRHNGVHFFDISTSKSGPTLTCFAHFHFETCFAPQRRALFRHLNFQKCSETQVFYTFSLGNVLRATTACNFSSLIWPAGSAPAALASLLFDFLRQLHYTSLHYTPLHSTTLHSITLHCATLHYATLHSTLH